mgnify:CR=1 FL=1
MRKAARHFDWKGRIESLEDRTVPATFVVNTTLDTPAEDLFSGTDASGNISLRSAIEAARLKWPRFQVVMLKGKPVTHLTEADIPNIYAADELDRTRKL